MMLTNHPVEYRKKPVVIKAMPVTAASAVISSAWLSDNFYPLLVGNALEPSTLRYPDQASTDDSRPTKGHYINPATGFLVIRTLEGDMEISLGDYLIQGVQGEFYPCKPDIFEASYEAVND